MAGTLSSPHNSFPSMQLPPGFQSIEQIQSAQVKTGSMVNVIGFLQDYQAPCRTNGTDFKCTLSIMDYSVQQNSYGLKVIIFWPEEKMPKICGVADVVLIRNVKAQMWQGAISLLANFSSEFHILPSSKIPTSLSAASHASWQSYPPSKSRRPTALELAYVIWANSIVKEIALPSTQEFHERSIQAMNVKDKFSLLKDIKPDCFYNILVEVIKIFDGSSDSLTLYVSDYTPNSHFYHHAWGGGGKSSGSRDGDEYGYTKSRAKTTTAWPGPYGKMSIQLTLYEVHADFVRSNVKVNDWVLMRNVQVKFGKIGGCLEGFLRGDRAGFEGKVQVELMEQVEDPAENDPRWKDAVGRKLHWWKKFKQQKQDLLNEAAKLGDKRNIDDEQLKSNSKKRRKERRAAAESKAAATEAKAMKKMDLNENLRCSNPDQPIMPFADILKQRHILERSESDGEHLSPVDVCNYRANVRVVGYFPHKIEDFSVGCRTSEFDMLSDYSGDEDTDPEEYMRAFRSGKGLPKKRWEWRFALEVEDASTKVAGERMWLMVDNHAAQGLLDLDATDLRGNPQALRDVREQLCILWGDLEEQKSAAARTNDSKTLVSSYPDTEQSVSPQRHKPGDQPPVDSDDEVENELPNRKASTKASKALDLKERGSNIGKCVNGESAACSEQTISIERSVKNKAFTCCIKQYAVKVDEKNPKKANAGNGKRWERKFGLFGTQII